MASIGSLLTPEKMSAQLKGIVSAERLLELAESKLIPHCTIDEVVYFSAGETRKWLNENFVVRHEGVEIGNGLATIVKVVSPAIKKPAIPVELRAMSHLLIPMELESVESPPISGVYFLCSNEKVVYIGQSVNVANRVGTHFGFKTFDAVLFLRVPKSDLNYVEGAFIRALQPKYNWTKDGKNLLAPSGCSWRDSQPSSGSVEMVNAMHE